MKKAIFVPILGILAITLFSFKPASSGTEGRIIHCSDGCTIIPTSCPITPADQMAIVSIVSSYGPDYGYGVYTDFATGAIQVYNATDPGVLAAVDAEYGSDLSGGMAFSFWLSKHKTWGPDKTFEESSFVGSASLVALNAELMPILARYE